MTDQSNYGLVRLLHPSGANISIPLPVDGSVIGPDVALALIHSVNNLLAAGLMVTMADSEGGSEITVTRVVRGLKNDKGSTISVLYFYENGMQFKSLTVYIDTPEDAAAFELVSGLKINDLPAIEGDAPPKADTDVFGKKSRSTNFRCIRKQKEGQTADGQSHPWKFVKYVGLPVTPPVIVQKVAPVAGDPNDRPIPSDDVLRAAYPTLEKQLPGADEATKKKNMKGIVWRLCQGDAPALSVNSNANTVAAQVKLDLMPKMAEASGK